MKGCKVKGSQEASRWLAFLMYQGHSVNFSKEVVSFCQEKQVKFLMESESVD